DSLPAQDRHLFILLVLLNRVIRLLKGYRASSATSRYPPSRSSQKRIILEVIVTDLGLQASVSGERRKNAKRRRKLTDRLAGSSDWTWSGRLPGGSRQVLHPSHRLDHVPEPSGRVIPACEWSHLHAVGRPH